MSKFLINFLIEIILIELNIRQDTDAFIELFQQNLATALLHFSQHKSFTRIVLCLLEQLRKLFIHGFAQIQHSNSFLQQTKNKYQEFVKQNVIKYKWSITIKRR